MIALPARQGPVRDTVLGAVGDQRPAVIPTFAEEVELVTALGAVLGIPPPAVTIDEESLWAPMADGQDPVPTAEIETQHLAVVVVTSLRESCLTDPVESVVPNRDEQAAIAIPRQHSAGLQVVHRGREREAGM